MSFPRNEDLTGRRYGKLLVLKNSGLKVNSEILWTCICDCGKNKNCKTGALRHGLNISCGCMNGGKTHGDWSKRIRHIYVNMKSRCYKPTDVNYHNYGGRGIVICNEWLIDYSSFKIWAYENGYSDDLSIDRKDSNGNYSPSNCKWSTPTEQARNTRVNRLVTFNNKTQCISAWAEEVGINQSRIIRRIANGWSIEKAISTPTDKNKISNRYRHVNQ